MKLLFRMTPQGAFYSGKQMDTYDFPFSRSDTVFKAIVKAWELLWGSVESEKLLNGFFDAQKPDDIPFFVSSFFPVVGECYFLPRPFSFRSDANSLPREMFKRLSWISAKVYRDWLNGEDISLSSENFIAPGLCIHPNERSLVNTNTPLWKEDDRTRNKIERKTTTAGTFQANQVYYAENLEYYLLAETHHYQSKLEAVFRLLAHEGIGGRRSIGCGGYTYHPPVPLPKELDFVDIPVDDGEFMVLSLCYPKINGKNSVSPDFRLIERQGWRVDSKGAPAQQFRVRLFREGSYFKTSEISMKSLLKTESSGGYHYIYPFRVVAPGVVE